MGRGGQGARHAVVAAVGGGGSAGGSRSSRSAGYYGEPLGAIEEELKSYEELGLAGLKFKVGGRSPAEDAERVARARAAAPAGFILAIDAVPGLQRARSAGPRQAGLGPRHRLVRRAGGLGQRRTRDARRADAWPDTGVCGAERALTGRVPRTDGARGDRRL